MKIAALAVAAMMSLGTLPAQAHHDHRDDNPVPAIIGGAILGGLLYYGNREYRGRRYHHGRRHHRSRVITEYRYDGRHFRICRGGGKSFYC